MNGGRLTIAAMMLTVLLVAFLLGGPILSPAHARSHALSELAVAAAAIYVFVYLLCVLMTYVRQWSAIEMDFRSIDPGGRDTAPWITQEMQGAISGLASLEFSLLGCYEVKRPTTNANAYIVFLERRSTFDLAKLLIVDVKVGVVRKTVVMLSFMTKFDDGSVLATGNSKVPRVIPSLARYAGSLNVPWVRNAFDLYEIHRALVAQSGKNPVREDHLEPDPSVRLRNFERETQEECVARGYYSLDMANKRYRVTWKGAALMVAKLIWPLKPIRAILHRIHSKRIVRGLGLPY
jgi:hypothetical protein